MYNKKKQNNPVYKELSFGFLAGLLIVMVISTSLLNYGITPSMAQTSQSAANQSAALAEGLSNVNSLGLPVNKTMTIQPFGKTMAVKNLPVIPKSKSLALTGTKLKITKPELSPFPRTQEAVKTLANKGVTKMVNANIKRISPAQIKAANTSANGSRPAMAINQTLPAGLNYRDGGGFTPPDIQTAAGGTHMRTQIFEMVNLAGKIWPKNMPSQAIGPFALSSFFQTGGDSLSDPQIVFDKQSGHWFSSIIDIDKGSVIVGVSNSDDASGNWHFYSLFNRGANRIPDQPIIATSQKYFMASVNDFVGTNFYQGAEYVIANKTEMVMNAGTLSQFDSGPDPTAFSVHPVQSLDSNPSAYMVSVGPAPSPTPTPTDHITLYTINGPCGPSECNLQVQQTNIPLTFPATTPPSANQPGHPTSLDTGDGRLLTSASSSGKIWLGFEDNCPSPSGSGNTACIDLLPPSGGTPVLAQDFDVATTDDSDIYYPALSIDGTGTMHFVFGISSTSQFPSVLLADESLSTVLVAATGTFPQTDSGGIPFRYGDYFGASIDPDGSTIWTAGEYVDSQIRGWTTQITSITP
jgi:hypothetical protein